MAFKGIKSITAALLAGTLLFTGVPVTVSAESVYTEAGAYTVGNHHTVRGLLDQFGFVLERGHGFAAEVGNNFVDRLKGKNASVVGNDFAKNGADRKIIGRHGAVTLIQTKYHSTAQGSINACFENDPFRYRYRYRYVDADGIPMQIEVPKDQYDEAVALMRKKIGDGWLKNAGVTDPADAETLVRKGNLTYRQAVNLARAGTVESLKYDAANGVVSASCAFGISALVNYAVCRLNGAERTEALRLAALEGVKTGGIVFGTAVISSQLFKTGTGKIFVPVTEKLVNLLGDDFARVLLQSVGVSAAGMTHGQLRKQAAKVLRHQTLTSGVSVLLLSADDAADLFRGRISSEQLLKNLTVTTAGVIGGTAGSTVGAAIGSAISPGIGTKIGEVVGGIVLGGAIGYGSEKLLGYFFRDDAEEMTEILGNVFLRLGDDYLLGEEEADAVVCELQSLLTEDFLKDMYADGDREACAAALIEPLMIDAVSGRETIAAPTEAEMRRQLKEETEGIVFIH